MFSLRDTIASALLGVQMPSAVSTNDSDNVSKKSKKKPHKKKVKKGKVEEKKAVGGVAKGGEDSESEVSDDGFDDVVNIGHFGVADAQTSEAKLTSALVYQFESTQIEDPLQIMIRKLAAECGVSVQLVSETVNRMFECGLQYDNDDAVRKEFQPKVVSRLIDVNHDSASLYTSAVSSPVPGHVSHGAFPSGNAPQPATNHAKTAASVPAAVAAPSAPARSSVVDADAAAALAKLTGTAHQLAPSEPAHAGSNPARGKHGREIGSAQLAAPASVPAAPATANTAAEPALTSMKEKLDFVAGFSRTSLYDSLAALCSWAAVSLPASTGASTATGVPATAQQERQQKMEAFFQSQALEILLSTLFSDEMQQLSSRQDVNSAFQALLQHILLLHGADAHGSATVHHLTEALGALITQISTLRSAQVLPAFAAPVSHGHGLLASQVAACVKRLYFQLNFAATGANSALSGSEDAPSAAAENSNEELFAQLAEIDAQLAKLDKSAGGKKTTAHAEVAQEKAQNLFLGREMHADKMSTCLESVKALAAQAAAASSKHASQRASAASQASSAAAVSQASSAADLHRSITESSADIERTLLNECNMLLNQPNSPVGVSRIAPGDANSLQSKHQQNHHITSHYERLSYERDAKLSVLSNEIGANNMRIQEVSAHKKRLLEQVALCDQELGALNGRGSALSADLNANSFYYQQQLEQLAHTGNSVRKSLQAHDQVNSLLGAVRAFETRFADALLHQHALATTASTAPHPVAQTGRTTVLTSSTVGPAQAHAPHASGTAGSTSGADEHRALLSERLLLLSGTTRGYVAAEGQCLRFLSERVEAAKGKLAACRKELLAYAALSMKGSVVQTAEASVAQLDAEIREDQQAARQLLQNVCEFVAQIKALQSALNPPIPKGKAPGSSRKPTPTDNSAAHFVVDMPGSEFARIVAYCAAMDVTVPAELVVLAGTASVPPSPVRAPAPAATQVQAHTAVASVPVMASLEDSVSASAPAATAAAAAPVVRKAPETSARGAPANTRDRAGAKGTSGRDTKPAGDRDGRKRGAPAPAPAAVTVDTTSAISLLEKSCLQKPSTGNAVKAASAKASEQPATKPVKIAAPVNSVWKTPASTSPGIQESKASEEVKTLKEIQAEQLNEKAQQTAARQQRKQPALTPAAAINSPAPTASPTAQSEKMESAAGSAADPAPESAGTILQQMPVTTETAAATLDPTPEATEPAGETVQGDAESAVPASTTKRARNRNRKSKSKAAEGGEGAEENAVATKDADESARAAAIASEEALQVAVIAAEEAIRAAAESAEQERLAAAEAERVCIAEEQAWAAQVAAEEEEAARAAAETAEQDRLAAEEAERLRVACEKAEAVRIAAEIAEQERQAADELLRIAEEKAETDRVAAETAEQERLAAEEAERARIAAEEAERARIAAEEAERARIAAEEAERVRIAAEEAERVRIAAEEAERVRIAAEEAERARIAAEEAEAIRAAAQAAEEAERARVAAEKAEAARVASETAEQERLAAEKAIAEQDRLYAEKAERVRAAVAEKKAALQAAKVEQERLTAEEAERARLAEASKSAASDAQTPNPTKKKTNKKGKAVQVAPAASDTTAAAPLSIAVGSPGPSMDSSSPLMSPLVEFHSLYPSLEEQIPVHESMEPSEYLNATPSGRGDGDRPSAAQRASSGAALVEASPLVEFHTTYPDLTACPFMDEVEESSDEEELGDEGCDYKNTTIDSSISAMSNQSTASLSYVRDLNPLSRPSPGHGSVRMKLDMSEGGPVAMVALSEDAPAEVPEGTAE